ncbi:MAG: hypothetical protein EWM72_02546 [Nitrospira sp.]|nr:MAG: hypothetical protein EWM72_02546 [Nitrospira sp.]
MSLSGSVRFPLLITCLSITLAGVSCTGGGSTESSNPLSSKGNNRPPVIKSAKILNSPLLLSRPVEVQIDAEDPEREPISFQYRWYLDNVLLAGQTNPTLPAEQLRRGQAVSVELTPADGTQKGEAYRTASVVVGNTPPRISSVALSPQTIEIGERLEAMVEASDPDHDRVDLTYRWLKNNVVIKEGEEPFLMTTGLIPQDQIAVEVTAHDPSATGNSLRSAALMVGNRPPKILSVPPASDATSPYEYMVKAVDPDGDHMTFQLDMAPPGMTIHEQSGQITWSIPSNQYGTFHIKVFAKDGQGGTAFQEFDLTLSAPAPTAPAGA